MVYCDDTDRGVDYRVPFTQWDPDVGFTAIPNIQSMQRNSEYKMTIQINSRGLRDREFPFIKPPRPGGLLELRQGTHHETPWSLPRKVSFLPQGTGVPIQLSQGGPLPVDHEVPVQSGAKT